MNSISLFDSHVHVHRNTDVAAMLSAAAANFETAARRFGAARWASAILLTEMSHRNWFSDIAGAAERVEPGEWQILQTAMDAVSTKAVRRGAVAEKSSEITIVAGRQIITSEKIEVLALGTRSRVEDGAPLEETITQAHDAGALVVLPWGAGKWLGERGRLVRQALSAERNRPIFAGDNRGRLAVVPSPSEFAIAKARRLPILPGTDPLALPGEERHVGAFGFGLAGELPAVLDGRTLEALIGRDPARVMPYGSHTGLIKFIANQTALRIRGERRP